MSLRDGPFHPLRIEAVPCDMGTAREHLSSFVRSFVRADGQARSEHILFRLARKHPDRLGALYKLLNDRYTSPPQDLSFPPNLPTSGVYLAGGDEAWLLQLEDAKVVSDYFCRDAVWSGVAGIYAEFLHHETMQWLCYRRSIAKET